MAKDEYDWNAWKNEPVVPDNTEDQALSGLDFSQAKAAKKTGQLTGVVSPFLAGLKSGVTKVIPEQSQNIGRAVGVLPTPSRDVLTSEQGAQEKPPEFGGFWPWLSKSFYEAGQMMPSSLAPTLAGAGIGAAAGAPLFGIGAIPGAIGGAAIGGLTGAGLFGAAQYQQTKEKAIVKGVDPGSAPLINAAIEAGFEGVSSLVKVPILKDVVKGGLKTGLGPLLKQAFNYGTKLAAGEVIPEMIQAGGESAVEKAYGIDPNVNPWSEAANVIAPTAIMAGVTGGFGAGAKKFMSRKRTVPTDLITGEPVAGEPISTKVLPDVPQFNKDRVQNALGNVTDIFLNPQKTSNVTTERQKIIDNLGTYFPELNDTEQGMVRNALGTFKRIPDTYSGSNPSGGVVEDLIGPRDPDMEQIQIATNEQQGSQVGIAPLIKGESRQENLMSEAFGRTADREPVEITTGKKGSETRQAAVINKTNRGTVEPDLPTKMITALFEGQKKIDADLAALRAKIESAPPPEQVAQEQAIQEQNVIEQGNKKRLAAESEIKVVDKISNLKNAAPGTSPISFMTKWGAKKGSQTTDPRSLPPGQHDAWWKPTGGIVSLDKTKPEGYWERGRVDDGVFTNERTRLEKAKSIPVADNLADVLPPPVKNVPAEPTKLQSVTEKKQASTEDINRMANEAAQTGEVAPMIQPTETFAGRSTEIIKQAAQSQKDTNVVNIVKDIVPMLGDKNSVSRTVAPDDPLIKSVLRVYKEHGYQWKSTPREVNLSFDKNAIRIQDISTMPGEAPSFQVTFTTDLSNKPGEVYKDITKRLKPAREVVTPQPASKQGVGGVKTPLERQEEKVRASKEKGVILPSKTSKPSYDTILEEAFRKAQAEKKSSGTLQSTSAKREVTTNLKKKEENNVTPAKVEPKPTKQVKPKPTKVEPKPVAKEATVPPVVSKELSAKNYADLRAAGITVEKSRKMTDEEAEQILTKKVVVKPEPVKTHLDVLTNSRNIENIYGRQISLRELVSTLVIRKNETTYASFSNAVRRAMGMDQSSEWGKFVVEHNLNKIYGEELNKSPRLVKKAISDIKKSSEKYPAQRAVINDSDKQKVDRILTVKDIAIPDKQELNGYYGKEEAKKHQDDLDVMFRDDQIKLTTKYSSDRFRLELPQDKTMAAWGKALERALNVKVVFYSASNKKGDRIDIQTSGRVLTHNSVAVNIADSKFKDNSQGLMLHTTWHEIGHIMQQRNPILYNDLTRMLFKNAEVRENYASWRKLFLEREAKNDKGETVKFDKVFKGYRMGESVPEFVNDLIGRAGYERKTMDLILNANDSVGDRVMRTFKYYVEKVLSQLNTWVDYLKGSKAELTPRLKYTENLYRNLKEVQDTLQDHIVQFAKNEIKSQRRVQANVDLSYERNFKMLPKTLKDFFSKAKYPGQAWYHGTVHDIVGNWITDRGQGSLDQRLGAQFGGQELASLFSMGQYTKFNHARNRDNGYMIYLAMKDEWHLPGGRIYPIFTSVENPKDLRSDKLQDWQQIQYDAFNTLFKENRSRQLFIDLYHDTLGLNRNDLNNSWKDMVKNDSWDSFFFEHDLPHFAELDPADAKAMAVADKFTKQYKNMLRSQGYDSIIYTHTDHEVDIDNTDALIVFDPDKIRSIYQTDEPGRLESNGVRFNGYQSDINFKSPNEEADKVYESNRGLGTKSAWEKTKDFAIQSYNEFKRHWAHLDPNKFGDVGNVLYKQEHSKQFSEKLAFDMIQTATGGLSPQRYGVFDRMMTMPDMIGYMEKLEASGKLRGQPFMGFKTVQEARDYHKYFEGIAKNDPAISKAIIQAKDMMVKFREQMVANKLLPEGVLSEDKPEYFRHQVLAYMGAKAIGNTPSVNMPHGESIRLQKAGWQKARTGSLENYNTDYRSAMYEVLAQGIQQVSNKECIEGLKPYDKYEEMHDAWKKGAEDPSDQQSFELYLKERGYKLWQPEKGNFLYQAYTITDKALERVMAEQRDDPNAKTQNLNEDMRGVSKEHKSVLGMPKPSWALPIEVAQQLDHMPTPPDDTGLARMSAFTLQKWKEWVLFNPTRYVKYELNNTSGDTDITMAHRPSILTKFSKQAATDLYWWTKDSTKIDPVLYKELIGYTKQNVLNSGLTLNEIGELAKPDFGEKKSMMEYFSDRDKTIFEKVKDAPGDYMNFVKKWGNYRENILRLASVRYFKDAWSQGIKDYGASNRNVVDDMVAKGRSIDDISSLLARELVGDYGNVSKAGQYIRRYLIPFWSWMEINAPRYVRLLQNATYEGDTAAAGRITGVVAKKTAVKVGMTVLKASALFAAISLYNKVVWPDEEEELRLVGRDQLHIILGRRDDGSIRTLRFQGALSDALSWFGFENFGQDMWDVVEGRKDWSKQLKETAMAPVNKILLATLPLARASLEIQLGKTSYPDISNPRPIRDPYEHFFRTLSFDMPYRYATRLLGAPKPVKGAGADIEGMVTYKFDPGEAAYYKIIQKGREYLAENNETLPDATPSPRSNALYYYKQSKKFNDDEAKEYWLEQFKKEGGKMQGIMQSVQKQEPTAFMPIKYKYKFIRGLDEQDKKIYDMAVEWYKKTYKSR